MATEKELLDIADSLRRCTEERRRLESRIKELEGATDSILRKLVLIWGERKVQDEFWREIEALRGEAQEDGRS